MTQSTEYQPPKVWSAPQESNGRFSNINRPEAGARFEADLPRGKHVLQLYSLATPNGQKVTIMLEELLAAGVMEAEYDAHLIRIMDQEQFSSGFVAINPNSKIPALIDYSAATPQRVFESGAILLYLADKFGHFLPSDFAGRTEALNWLFWLQGSAPFVGGGFGHFYAYAPFKQEYPINRYTMETKRLLDVLDQRLAQAPYLAGDEYSIADMASWPWFGGLMNNTVYGAAEFLNAESYTHVRRWVDEISARPAVQRGIIVNSVTGEPEHQLHSRHQAADIDAVLEARRKAAE
ncbi:glutathione-dependent disulfide-bond oxidoreductase [Achromobacter sp. F4_2707]|uniref:glutathione-dependent disulfide-bond oxidoreductase n=1 Tax=Achromobacter sp. F4_2707 TaxID=3114286 RepID=UPI0039C6E64D